MPRIEVEDAVELGLIDDQEVETHKDDPGAIGPWDLCIDCYDQLQPIGDVAHPPYEHYTGTSVYRCMWCFGILGEEDNGYI